MKIKEMKRHTKADLFQMLDKLDAKITYTKKKCGQSKTRLKKMCADRRRLKHYIYECLYCAEASTTSTFDKHGNEKEFLLHDCGRKECPYHEYFYKLAHGMIQEKDVLHILLKTN